MDPLSSSTPEQASGDSSGPSRFNELTECELGLPVTQAEHSTDDWVKAIGEEQDDADTYYWWQNPSSAPEYTTTDLETLCYPRKTLIGPEHCISTAISFLVNPKTRSKILTVQCSKCEGSRDYTLETTDLTLTYSDVSSELDHEELKIPESSTPKTDYGPTEANVVLLGPDWEATPPSQPPETSPAATAPPPAATTTPEPSEFHGPEREADRAEPKSEDSANRANPKDKAELEEFFSNLPGAERAFTVTVREVDSDPAEVEVDSVHGESDDEEHYGTREAGSIDSDCQANTDEPSNDHVDNTNDEVEDMDADVDDDDGSELQQQLDDIARDPERTDLEDLMTPSYAESGPQHNLRANITNIITPAASQRRLHIRCGACKDSRQFVLCSKPTDKFWQKTKLGMDPANEPYTEPKPEPNTGLDETAKLFPGDKPSPGSPHEPIQMDTDLSGGPNGANTGAPGAAPGAPGRPNGTPGAIPGAPGRPNGNPGAIPGAPGQENYLPGVNQGTSGVTSGPSKAHGDRLPSPRVSQPNHQGDPAQLEGLTKDTPESTDTDPRYHEAYSPAFPPGTETHDSVEPYEPTKPTEEPDNLESGGKAESTGPEKPEYRGAILESNSTDDPHPHRDHVSQQGNRALKRKYTDEVSARSTDSEDWEIIQNFLNKIRSIRNRKSQ